MAVVQYKMADFSRLEQLASVCCAELHGSGSVENVKTSGGWLCANEPGDRDVALLSQMLPLIVQHNDKRAVGVVAGLIRQFPVLQQPLQERKSTLS